MTNKAGTTKDDYRYAIKHGLLQDDVGRAVRRAFEAGVVDDFVIGHIKACVQKHTEALAMEPFLPPQVYGGEMLLGFDRKNMSLCPAIETWNDHSLILGGSGSGKSILSKWVVIQVAPQIRGTWLFDCDKRDLATLRPNLARFGVKLDVVDARSLRINPLQVPAHVDPRAWASRAADLFVRTLQLPPRASKLINITILTLYRDFGVLEGGDHFPTMFELRIRIAENKQANPAAKSACIDALDPVLASIGDALRYRVGWSTQELAKRHLVFEFGNVGVAETNICLASLIFAEFASRVGAGATNRPMDLFIVCDDAARIVSAANPSDGLIDLMSLVRGAGVGLWFCTQSGDIAPGILSNTANKILGRCTNYSDLGPMCASLGLGSEQRQYLSQHLSAGVFLGQLAKGWRRPFVFRVPAPRNWSRHLGGLPARGLMALPSAAHVGNLASLPVVAAPEFADWDPNRKLVLQKPACPTEGGDPDEKLSDEERRFLEVVLSDPTRPSSSYPKLVRMSPLKAKRIRDRLVDGGFLREHRVNRSQSGRGRAAIILEPLHAAYEFLGRVDSDSGGAA